MSGQISRSRVAMLTILALAGTLTACGRYGPPVRPSPNPSPSSLVRETMVRETSDAAAAMSTQASAQRAILRGVPWG